jgi:AraC-like DNA-binding protein
MTISELEFEAGFALTTQQQAAEVELVISKGGVLGLRSPDGWRAHRGGNTLQAGRSFRALPVHATAERDLRLTCVGVALSRARWCELLGVPALPAGLQDEANGALISEDMTPQLFRLLEEITHADARGRSRLLWHEAKCQELIALVSDELAEAATARKPAVSARDLEGLERVRQRLHQRLESTPTLAELAKLAGLNETKLKGAFRAAFGAPVFGYLRRARLEEARRLLLERRLNVTEVALRVGYANPSKFAAAFRRHFELSPSDL